MFAYPITVNPIVWNEIDSTAFSPSELKSIDEKSKTLAPGPTQISFSLFFSKKKKNGDWSTDPTSLGYYAYSEYFYHKHIHPTFFNRHLSHKSLEMSPPEFYAYLLARRELVTRYLNQIGVSGMDSKNCFAVSHFQGAEDYTETASGTNPLSFYCLESANMKFLQPNPEDPEFNERLAKIHQMYKMEEHHGGWVNKQSYWFGGNCSLKDHYVDLDRDVLVCDHFILSELMEKTLYAMYSELPGRKLHIFVQECQLDFEDGFHQNVYNEDEFYPKKDDIDFPLITSDKYTFHDIFPEGLTDSLSQKILKYLQSVPAYDPEHSIVKSHPISYRDILLANFDEYYGTDVDLYLEIFEKKNLKFIRLFDTEETPCKTLDDLRGILEKPRKRVWEPFMGWHPIFMNKTSDTIVWEQKGEQSF